MAKKNAEFQITTELQETLKKNPKIKEVYFNEEGEHFFNKHTVMVHSVDEESGFSTGTQEVQSLPGVVRGLIKVPVHINKRKEMKDALVNVSYEPIAATFSREDVLNSKAVSKILNEKEQLAILSQAANILKGKDIQEFVEKLNAKN